MGWAVEAAAYDKRAEATNGGAGRLVGLVMSQARPTRCVPTGLQICVDGKVFRKRLCLVKTGKWPAKQAVS